MERVSPHKVAICSLISLYVRPTAQLTTTSRQNLALFLLKEACGISGKNVLEPSLRALQQSLIASVPGSGEDLAEILSDRLLAFQCPDDIITYFISLRECLVSGTSPSLQLDHGANDDIQVEARSSLGLFIRSCCLLINKLSFEGVCQLLQQLQAYVEAAGSSTDADILGGVLGPVDPWSSQQDACAGGAASVAYLRPLAEIDAIAHDKALLLERQGTAACASLPPELALELEMLQELAPCFPQAHHLQYLACRNQKDYLGLEDSLHRYYDYSAGALDAKFAKPKAAGVAGGGPSGAGASGHGVGRSQAAVLALGASNIMLGHQLAGLQALVETIRIAQQNNDGVTLLQALAYLCHAVESASFGAGDNSSAAPLAGAGGAVAELRAIGKSRLLALLARATARAEELSQPQLAAFGRLAIAKLCMRHVWQQPAGGHQRAEEAITPLHVRQLIQASWQRSTEGDLTSRAPATPSLEVSLAELKGSAHLLSGAAWEMYGSAPLARLAPLLHRHGCADVASADDHGLAAAQLAMHTATQQGIQDALLLLERECGGAVEAGCQSLHVQRAKHTLRLQAETNRGAFGCAADSSRVLASLSSPLVSGDAQAHAGAGLMAAEALLASDRVEEALRLSTSLFASCRRFALEGCAARVLLLMAKAHMRAGAPVSAMPYAVGALALSRSLHMHAFAWEATLTVAEAWLAMDTANARHALSMIDGVMPLVLGHGPLALQGQAHLLSARCLLYSRSRAELLDDPEDILGFLSDAMDCFTKMQMVAAAKETCYLAAMVFNLLERTAERDQASAAFLHWGAQEVLAAVA